MEWHTTSIGLSVIFFENLVSEVMGHISVPFLFVIAGFLFFKNYELTYENTKQKLSRRTHSLLIPYLIWNAVTLVGLFVIQLKRPDLSIYFNQDRTLIVDYTVWDFLNGFLGIRDVYIYNRPLWFIRDLMIMALFSPCFWLVLKRLPLAVTLSALGVIWFLVPNLWPLRSGLGHDGLVFYSIGALIAIRTIDITWIDKHGKIITCVFIVLSVLEAYLRTIDYYHWRFHRTVLVMGILCIWYVSKEIMRFKTLSQILRALSGFAFFVYVSHMPIFLKIVRGALQLLLPFDSLGVLFAYIAAVLITVPLLVTVAYLLRMYLPNLFAVLNGQRQPRFQGLMTHSE
jgi:hypothetical protein